MNLPKKIIQKFKRQNLIQEVDKLIGKKDQDKVLKYLFKKKKDYKKYIQKIKENSNPNLQSVRIGLISMELGHPLKFINDKIKAIEEMDNIDKEIESLNKIENTDSKTKKQKVKEMIEKARNDKETDPETWKQKFIDEFGKNGFYTELNRINNHYENYTNKKLNINGMKWYKNPDYDRKRKRNHNK
ncbi:MAG: hypothetical protein K9N00_04150 [Candidatus Marinimicrobia bacterium]|nr:hypothetical protein [Candidatus Neomarinimicrobiota bacterium]